MFGVCLFVCVLLHLGCGFVVWYVTSGFLDLVFDI